MTQQFAIVLLKDGHEIRVPLVSGIEKLIDALKNTVQNCQPSSNTVFADKNCWLNIQEIAAVFPAEWINDDEVPG